ncbi:MAG: two-component system response regulator DegU [Crocinitomix sp.]|jgi:two-component system response regulator DegU
METIKIGLVDDHTLFREGMKSLLANVQNVDLVLEATSGTHLFEQLQYAEPNVLLLDLDMEDGNGMEATVRLSKEFPEIKIIILTMHKEDRMISYMMEIGAHGYLLKDTNQKELSEAIEKVHQQGFYFNPRIAEAMLKGLKNKRKTLPSLGIGPNLTNREKDVLQLISQELTTAEIAAKLFLSERTIEGYRKNLLMKMGVKNTAGLILKAIKEGLLQV